MKIFWENIFRSENSNLSDLLEDYLPIPTWIRIVILSTLFKHSINVTSRHLTTSHFESLNRFLCKGQAESSDVLKKRSLRTTWLCKHWGRLWIELASLPKLSSSTNQLCQEKRQINSLDFLIASLSMSTLSSGPLVRQNRLLDDVYRTLSNFWQQFIRK